MIARNSRAFPFHSFISLLLIAVLLTLAVPTVLAGGPAAANIIATCTNGTLHVDWMITAPTGGGTVSLVVNGSTVDSRTITNTNPITGTYSTAGTGVMTVVLHHSEIVGGAVASQLVTCDPVVPVEVPQEEVPTSPFACNFGDNRINAFECAPPAIPFCMPWGIDVYVMDPETGEGELLMAVRDEIIEAIGVPDENTKLAQVDDIILSRLSTGEFQLNALDGEGNAYVLVWDGCPPSKVYNIKSAE